MNKRIRTENQQAIYKWRKWRKDYYDTLATQKKRWWWRGR